MHACSCGRSFRSPEAMDQHRRDLASQGVPVIHLTSLEASTFEVNSLSEARLLGTYNWHPDGVKFPGYARIWHDVPLPAKVPRDTKSSINQNAALVLKYPFKTLLDATAFMRPDFRFDDMDVVINRNSLRKLLDFCNNRSCKDFSVGHLFVQDTLVVEINEREYMMMMTGSSNTGYGHNFETAFTTPAPGLGKSTSHNRILEYKLGDLNFVVQFEVDAGYRGEPENSNNRIETSDLPLSQIQALALQHSQQPNVTSAMCKDSYMPQSMTAELKTGSQNLKTCLPQLWFGRTPWLIRGKHKGGFFHHVEITNLASEFSSWEMENQDSLRKLVTVLSRLREGIKLHGGRNCVAIIEQGVEPRSIKIFPSTKARQVLVRKELNKFWTGKKTAPVPSEASLS